MWDVKEVSKFSGADVLITGLPGIGNIGKIAVDFMIDELKAKKVYEFFSHSMPHSVFVNEDNLVDLPKIELYNYKKILFLAGDVQPTDEPSCYAFCEKILDIFEKRKGKEIITLGGIGLRKIPKTPQIYCTGNDEKIIKKYKKGVKLNPEVFGVVGPIMGVAGLLLGLAKKRNIPAISMLAETFAHPAYVGLRGSKSILEILDKKLELKLDLKNLDKEIDTIEEQVKHGKTLSPEKLKYAKPKDTSYIG